MGGLGNNLFQFAYLYARVKDGIIPDLYLQDPKYFEQCAEEVKGLLQDGIGFIPFVSIHVRRGTNEANPNEPAYADNPFYVNLSDTDYYEKAIEMFPKKNFLVFSDDIEFCKTKFTGDRFQFIEDQTEVEDLNMMASCESNIIANSSFSWWAAFLNPNPIKTVVAPKHWHPDEVERTRCPDNWIRL
jgi:hypothetical protein